MEIPVVITRTEYDRLLEIKNSFAVLEKRLQAAENRAVPTKSYSDYEYGIGMDMRGEAEQRIKIKTKDGLTCISDRAYPQSHTRIRTACTKAPHMFGLLSSDPVAIEYRNYEFVGRCRETGLRMFEEL